MIVYFRFFLNFSQFELKENFLTFVSFQRIRNRISFVIMLAVNTNMHIIQEGKETGGKYIHEVN